MLGSRFRDERPSTCCVRWLGMHTQASSGAGGGEEGEGSYADAVRVKREESKRRKLLAAKVGVLHVAVRVWSRALDAQARRELLLVGKWRSRAQPNARLDLGSSVHPLRARTAHPHHSRAQRPPPFMPRLLSWLGRMGPAAALLLATLPSRTLHAPPQALGAFGAGAHAPSWAAGEWEQRGNRRMGGECLWEARSPAVSTS